MLTFISENAKHCIINQGVLETDSFKIWVGDINCPVDLKKLGAGIIAGAWDKVQQLAITVENCDEGLKLQLGELLPDGRWQIAELTKLKHPQVIAATDSWMLFVSQELDHLNRVRASGTLLNIKEALQLMNGEEATEIKEKAMLHFQSPDTAFSIIPAEGESPERPIFFCPAGNLELSEFIDYLLTQIDY